uniref:VWFA domain-containing protein n=1 Tax=Plectus sambesii TaxID=2011161 RepID=A0A914WTE1_9BILA
MNTIVQAWPIQGTPNLTSLLTTYGQQYLTAAGGQNARDGIPKTLIILSASADPSDVNSAAAIAKGYQGVTIITIGIEPNVASSTPLQPISSGTGFAFSAILNNLASLVPQVVSAACMQPPAPPLNI